MAQSDSDVPQNQQVLPPIPLDAIERIEQAEKTARERYDRHTMPYFPTNPDFSFFEQDIFRSKMRIIEYVRIFAEEILDAHLREYLQIAPLDLLTNGTLLESVARNVLTLTDELWTGYHCILFTEPSGRRARYIMAMAEKTMDQHPELEPWRYPEGENWANLWQKMTQPDSEMARLNRRYEATIMKALTDRIRAHQDEAASGLGVTVQPPVQPGSNPAGESIPGSNPAETGRTQAPTASVGNGASMPDESLPNRDSIEPMPDVHGPGSAESCGVAYNHDQQPEQARRVKAESVGERNSKTLVSSQTSVAPGEVSSAVLDFASGIGRCQAVASYAERWHCSEASLARTATVHPADLSKWKRGGLPAESDKKARIERALRNNEPPTCAARLDSD
jgi:hypothetical protein